MSNAAGSLARIREELNHNFQERGELVDGALCALLSGSHVLIIGPPGTAKSMLADELCRRIEGANYFQWLLTKFSTPEEIFGAVSLKGLEEDDYRRVTSNELPDEDELTALYDRFMLRFMADYITEEHGFIRMMAGGPERARTTLKFAELDELRALAASVTVPGAI